MAAPTFVQDVELASWFSASTPRGSGDFTTSTGDVVIAASVAEDSGGSPRLSATGTNVTTTEQQTVAIDGFCEIDVSAGVVSSGGTTSVSFANTTTTFKFGGNTITFSSTDGIGASNSTNAATGAPTLSLTTTQANSAVVVVVADWNAADGASRTWNTVNSITPTSGNGFELTYARDAAVMSVYIAYYPDVGAAGAKTFGMSLPSSMKYSIAAIEIKGTAGGGSPALDDSGTFPGFEAQSSPTVISIW